MRKQDGNAGTAAAQNPTQFVRRLFRANIIQREESVRNRYDVRTVKVNHYRPSREGCKVSRKFAGYTPYTVADRKAHYDGERERAAWFRGPLAHRRTGPGDNDHGWNPFEREYSKYKAGSCGRLRWWRAANYRTNLQRSGRVPWEASCAEIIRAIPEAAGPFPALWSAGTLRF